MPAARAASSRLIPSEALASASSRLLTRPSRSRRASARSSAGVRPVAIGTATMAQAPGLLSLPGQLAGRRRRSRLPVAGITREHGLLAHQRAGHPRGPKAHDGTITTERVDVMWGTDLTSVMTGEGQAAVFVAVDHCSAECVGIHASRGADRFEALEPV